MEKIESKYNDEYFSNKGYKEYPPSKFHNASISKCFQKRFDDSVGKKYFIDVNKWDWSEFADRVPFDITYEAEVQLYKYGTHDAVNLTFHNTWDFEEIERTVERLFQTGMFDYYERWDEC